MSYLVTHGREVASSGEDSHIYRMLLFTLSASPRRSCTYLDTIALAMPDSPSYGYMLSGDLNLPQSVEQAAVALHLVGLSHEMPNGWNPGT